MEQTPQSDDPVWGRVEDGPSQSSPETSLKTVRRVAVQPVGMAVESTVEVRAVSVLQPVRCQVRLETGSVVSALVDSGAEISLLHSSMLPEPWLQSQPQRSVKLQGAFADPIQGHVVRVGAGLADANEGVHLEVAVTPELVGESMLLTPSDYAALVEASPTCTLSGGFISNTRVRPDPSVRDPDEQFRHDMETSLVHDVREVTVDSVGRVPFPVDLSSYLESSTSEGAEEFKRAQVTDEGLASVWKEARDVRKKSSYFVDEAKGLLFRRKQFGANAVSQLVVPACKRAKVLEIAHDSPWGGHFGANKTLKRIELNFTWPGISVDVAEYTRSCVKCQLKARKTRRDMVPISPVERPWAFGEVFCADLIGPLEVPSKGGHKYVLVLIDAATGWVELTPLRTLSAKELCGALLLVWTRTGIPCVMVTDNGTNFKAELTTELYRRFGIESRFSTPGHPQGNSRVERANKSVKAMLHHLVTGYTQPRKWASRLPYLAWCLRETPSSSTGVSPHQMVYGRPARGPLAVLKDSWSDGVSPDRQLSRSTEEYLGQLGDLLVKTRQIAAAHLEAAQDRNERYYNPGTQDKSFEVGDQVIFLMPTSTNKLVSTWQGPGTVVAVRSPHSYFVALPSGAVKLIHANDLRRFHCRSLVVGIMFDDEAEFGDVQYYDKVLDEFETQFDALDLGHLDTGQRVQLFDLLKRYERIFSDQPGSCKFEPVGVRLQQGVVRPKPQRMYRIPEKLKPEVQKQIDQLLADGKVRPSTSEWCHPIVCVPKKDGSIRVCTDLRYLNSCIEGDAFPMPVTEELLASVSRARYITTVDATQGYFQIPMRDEDCHFTAFRGPEGLYEWTVLPFGLKTAPQEFGRRVALMLRPHEGYASAYIDDINIFSDGWKQHLDHLDRVFKSIEDVGMTLKMSKCQFAKPEVKLLGHVAGSGKRTVDPGKVEAIRAIPEPTTKKKLRSFLGAVQFYRGYLGPEFSEWALPLTDLTKKGVSNTIRFDEKQRAAFLRLKEALCQATALHSPDSSRPYTLRTDASDRCIGAELTQTDPVTGNPYPVAFYSAKLTEVQSRWSTVEREGYAVLAALRRFDYLLYGAEIHLQCDQLSLSYLRANPGQSSKLVRWGMALQRYNIASITHIPGKENVWADFLSRP